MVRIADIFKKQAPSKAPSPAEVKPKAEPLKAEPPKEKFPQEELRPGIQTPLVDTQLPKAMPPKEQREQTETAEDSVMRIAKGTKATAQDRANSGNLYLTGIQLIRETLSHADNLQSIDLVQIELWISNMVDRVMSEDRELMRLFYEYTSDNYLHSHMVNTTIMSIELGSGLGYNKSQLSELSLGAFLHDIGMIKVEELAMEKRRLSEKEYNQIKDHPLYGVNILSKIKDIAEPIIYLVKEEHERMNGTGYPNLLKDGDISEYGRIIAIADVFEALTHDRPYRKKNLPHEAIKEMVADSQRFDSAILKVLIDRVGVYPISSWIELNSDEIGKVIGSNSDFPLRPVVQILFDASGKRLKNPREVNLAKQFNLFIKKSLMNNDLLKKVKEPIEI